MNCAQCGGTVSRPTLLGVTPQNAIVIEYTCPNCGTMRQPYTNLAPIKMQRAPKFPPPQGQWFRCPDGRLQICCPLCRGLSPIAEPVHAVADDGAVSPSVVCPYGCGFHAFVSLDEYDITAEAQSP